MIYSSSVPASPSVATSLTNVEPTAVSMNRQNKRHKQNLPGRSVTSAFKMSRRVSIRSPTGVFKMF